MNKEPTGYLGNTTPQQDKVVEDLRASLSSELARYPEINTKWSLLRFCRARNFDINKTKAMLKSFIKWRDERDMHRISSRDYSDFANIVQNHESGRYGVDKQGRPFIIERLGLSNTKAIMTLNDKQTIEDYFIQLYERSVFIEFPLASQQAGRRIDETFIVLDLKNVQVTKVFDSKFKEFLKFLTVLSQDYYPEILGRMFIVNAPFLFKGIWSIVKLWLDQKTKSKIEMHSDVPLKKLQEYVDVDQLPDFLKGTCTRPIKDNYGPWKEAIEESKKRRSFFLKDRTPEYTYFYEEGERRELAKEALRKEVPLDDLKEDFYQLGIKPKEIAEELLEEDIHSKLYNTEYLKRLAQSESDIIKKEDAEISNPTYVKAEN